MKTCTVSEAKSKLGELADSAIQGKPTVIVRGGKLVILQDESAALVRQRWAARESRRCFSAS